MSDKDRSKALDVAISKIEKQFGKGAIMRLGSEGIVEIAAISTGSIGLDAALGIGGFPKGRVVEIYGPESSGKTTLALSAVAQAQKAGGAAAFIDAEHALDVGYAQKLGVNVDDLLVSQPDTGEQALEVAETLVRSGALDIIVIDSVAALVPRAEIEGEMATIVFINQIRMKIGVMFGSPETTTGGNALKFYSSVRLDIRRIEQLKTATEAIGNRVRVKVVKNKVAPPFKQAEFDIYFNEGISKVGELIDLGLAKDIVERAGAWYSYGGTRIGQGREKAKQYLKENPEAAQEIEAKILEAYNFKK